MLKYKSLLDKQLLLSLQITCFLLSESLPYCAEGWSVVGLQKRVCIEIYFLYFSSKTYVVGTQKNRLNETVLLGTKNTC